MSRSHSKKTFRLLIVDDQKDQSLLTQKAFLQVMPTAKITEKSSEEAVSEFLTYCTTHEWDLPTLILLDLYMPKRENGYQVLSTIRSLPKPLNQVPVIMLTSSAEPEDVYKAYQLGCTSYMVKPLVLSEWIEYFQALKTYWMDTATLPYMSYSI